MAVMSCVQLGDYVRSAVEICDEFASSVTSPSNRQLLLGDFEADIGQILGLDPALGGNREKWERLCNLTNSRLAGVEGATGVVKLRGQSRLSFHSAALWLIDIVRTQIATVTNEIPDWRTHERARDAVFSGLRQIPLCDSLYEGKFATGLAREALEVSRDCQDKFEVLLPGENGKISGPKGIPIAQWVWLLEQDRKEDSWSTIFENIKVEAAKASSISWKRWRTHDAMRRWLERACGKRGIKLVDREKGRKPSPKGRDTA